MIEPGGELFYPKRSGARRSEFDRKRDTVEAPTNPGDRGPSTGVRRKVWRGRAYPLDEQPNRAVSQRVLAVRAVFRSAEI